MTDEIYGQLSLFDQDTWYGKMSPEPSAPIKEMTSELYWKKWQGLSKKESLFLDLRKENGVMPDASLGMGGALPGGYLMPNIGAYLNGEEEYALSQILTATLLPKSYLTRLNNMDKPVRPVETHLSEVLEMNPDPKYNLSETACRGILTRANRRGKTLPPMLQEALEQACSQCKTEKDVGGGGKGVLIQDDMATSLRTSNYMTLFQPTVLESNQNHAMATQNGVCPTLSASMGLGGGYVPMITSPACTIALEGNGQRPSHRGDGYAETDKSFTLNTTETHGVAYMKATTVYKGDGATGGDQAFAIVGGHDSTISDMTNLVVGKNYIDAEMEVLVRKFPVDIEGLKQLLKDYRGNMSKQDIAEKLGKPLTMVEHWFRTDKYFAIPDPDVWFDLKNLLGITTTEFDESITTFETKPGNYDMRNRIYAGDQTPTLQTNCGNDLYLVPDLVMYQREFGGKATENPKTSPTLEAAMGEGGNNQPIVCHKGGIECLETFHCVSESERSQPLKARDYKDPLIVCYENISKDSR